MTVQPQQVSVSARIAFKIGFFGAFGVFIASLVPFAILILVILSVSASIINGLHTGP